MSAEDESPYGLVMPFLPVQSKGGPHDDNAYVAGFQMGRLDGLLNTVAAAGLPLTDWFPEGGETLRRDNREQADLIAMRYGFVASFDEYQVEVFGAEVNSFYIHMKLRAAAEVTP